jgi:hypothetical protein
MTTSIARSSGAVPAPIRAAAQPLERQALQFTGWIMIASLFLQRFGVPFGDKSLSIVGPIGMALAGVALARGTLGFDLGRLATFLILASCVLLGVAWHAASPGGFEAPLNVNSLSQFLVLSSFAVLKFAAPIDEGRFYRKVNFYLMLIAVAGLIQFVAQFAGVRIFEFTGLLPDKILFETGYNLQIPLGVGDVFKANGFFLVEPSVFSQLMAMAMIIEVISSKRLVYLALFATGLLLSFSGTGWIVLATFVLVGAIGMGWRGLAVALTILAVIGLVTGIAAWAVPSLVEAFQSRLGEISRPGTSGHMRFITPFWLLSDILSAVPSAAFLGIGGGGSERLSLPYEYDVNTPIKVAVDYGFPALLAYVSLFIVGRKTALQKTLVPSAVVMFLFMGGYQQFPPMVFFVLLVIAVANLKPSSQI